MSIDQGDDNIHHIRLCGAGLLQSAGTVKKRIGIVVP